MALARPLILVILAAAFTGCGDGSGLGLSGDELPLTCTAPTDPRPVLGSTFNVHHGDRSTLVREGLTLTFEQLVRDTRCPAGMLCILPGEADVVVRAQLPPHPSAALELSTLDVTTAVATYRDFQIRLARVVPYPEGGRPPSEPSDYCVELIVTPAS